MTTFGGCTVPFVYGGGAACTLNPTFVVAPAAWSVAPPPDGLGSRTTLDPAGNQIGFDTSGAPPSVVTSGGGATYERYTRIVNLNTGASSAEVNNTVTNTTLSPNTQAQIIQGSTALHRARLVNGIGQPTHIMGASATSSGVAGCTQPNGASSFFALGNTLAPQEALYDAVNDKVYVVPAGDSGVNESFILRFSPTSNVFEVSGIIASNLSPPGMGATQIVGLSEDFIWVQRAGDIDNNDSGDIYLQQWSLDLSTVTDIDTGFAVGPVFHVFCDQWVVAPGTGGDDVDILDLDNSFNKVQGFDFNTPAGFDSNAVLMDLHTLYFPLNNEIWAISE